MEGFWGRVVCGVCDSGFIFGLFSVLFGFG